MTAMSTAITRQIVLDTETTGMNQIGAHYEEIYMRIQAEKGNGNVASGNY